MDDKIFTISLTAEDLKVINSALIKEPYVLVAFIIGKINDQLKQQAKQPVETMDG